MQKFHNYLNSKHFTSKKKVHYYVIWITRLYEFIEKIGSELLYDNINCYFNYLTKSAPLQTSLPGTIKKGLSNYRNCQTLDICGAGGENRTRTGLPPVDFESTASTSFTTPASG